MKSTFVHLRPADFLAGASLPRAVILFLFSFALLCFALFGSGCSTPLKQLAPLVEQLKADQAKFKLTVVAAGISVTLEREMPTNFIPPAAVFALPPPAR